MCSLIEKKHEMMKDWKNIANRSKRVTDYLKGLFLEEESPEDTFTGDPMEERIVERLSRPGYLQQKREEQRRFDADAAFGKLKRRNRRRVMIRVSSVAASVAILLGVIWLFQVEPESVKNVPLAKKVIVPGERKAVLVLDDGRELDLKGTRATRIETAEGVIHIDSVGVIRSEETGEGVAEDSYNKLIIPRGGEYHLVLSDGTNVWLNSETELHFPIHFKGNSRKVYLKGEAYFDVKTNPDKPFIVNTAAGDVKVLGTAFDVEVYDTTTMVATLERGAISYVHGALSEIVLRPGEQLTYKTGSNQPRVSKVNTRLYTAWKDHLFCFEEQRLSEIMTILARWYDLKVRFDSEELKNVELSGTLDKYSDVSPLLNLFELGTNVKFEIEGNVVTVKKAK